MKTYKNHDLAVTVSKGGDVNQLHAFGQLFNAEQGILHIGSTAGLQFATKETIHSGIPLLAREVNVTNQENIEKPFEIWFHQNFKEQADNQIGFYSPCEQSFIHYVDGVYFLFGVQMRGADKSIRYALSNDARPSYQQLQSAPGNACWRPLASGRVDSTLCLEGTLAPYETDTISFHMVAALNEKELFEYYSIFQTLDSFHSMQELKQHDPKVNFLNEDHMETQSC